MINYSFCNYYNIIGLQLFVLSFLKENIILCVNYRTYVKESDVVSGIQPETKPLNDHLRWSSVEVWCPLPKTKMLSFFFTTWIKSTVITWLLSACAVAWMWPLAINGQQIFALAWFLPLSLKRDSWMRKWPIVCGWRKFKINFSLCVVTKHQKWEMS